MSPKIFEYRGITLSFFSNEHLPAHVHAIYAGECGMKVEFYLKGDKIVRKDYSVLKGYEAFPPAQMKDLKKLINKYEYDIVDDFINFAFKNLKVKTRIITRKIE